MPSAALMPTPRAAVWAIPTATALSVVVGVLLTSRSAAAETGYLVVDAVVGATYPVVGALLVSRRPRNPVGWMFIAAGAGLAAQALAGGIAVASSGAAALVAAWVMDWVFFAGLGPLLLLPLLLPDGRLPSPRWRPVLGVLIAALAVLTAMLMFRDELWVWGTVSPNPVGVVPTEVVAPCFGAVVVSAAVAGVAALVARLRGGGDEVRRRLLPILTASVVIAVAVVADALLPPVPAIGTWLLAIALPLLPLGTGASVLRYRLFDLELAVRRTLVVVATAGLLLVAYLGVVAIAQALLAAEAAWAAPLAGAAVVAAAAAPLGRLVGRGVARFLFGDRSDPGTALARLGERLEASAATGSPLRDSAETVAVTLRLPGVAVVDADGRVVSTFPATTDAVTDAGADAAAAAVPLRAAGRIEGVLHVAARARGEALSRSDLAVLDDLARPLALALAADRLAREVRASRERLVVAREDERRRLRRELHDGLGPGLAAIGIQLDLAGAAPPDRAGVALARARGLVDELVREIRRIVHDLRPAALDELGLRGALEDLAFAAGGPAAATPVEVVSGLEVLPMLPAATEVAAYRIVQEAIANALKHADARRISVRLDAVGDLLRITVEDDGRGVPPDAAEGVGSSSMRERAAEIGGALRRESGPAGGTIVIAELPLDADGGDAG